MAKVLKAGARKPRIEDGFVGTNCDYAERGDQPGVMPHMEYKLSVTQQGHGPEYAVQLTEAEMLRAISQWMAMYTRNRLRELTVKSGDVRT